MTAKQMIESLGLDDLVFENRNKIYGAYELRKHYDDRLIAAFFTAISFFVLLMLLSLIRGHHSLATHTPGDGGVVHPFYYNGHLEHPPLIRSLSSNNRIAPVITNRHVDTFTHIRTMISSTEGSTNGTGPESTGQSSGTETSGGQGQDSIPETPVTHPEFETFYEVAPVFPGGFRAMEDFFRKHMQIPPQAMDYHVSGRIFVELKIKSDGSIAEAQIVKGIGYGCDEEVLRVIHLMPAWKPGQSGKHAVPVRVTIPVTINVY
jgi:protein TonB